MKSKLFIFAFSATLLFSSCADDGKVTVIDKKENSTKEVATNIDNSVKSGVLLEELQASSYTYLKMKTEEGELWFAIPKAKLEIGKKYYYKLEMPAMKNFPSRDLNRTFESVLFLSGVSDSPNMEKKKHNHDGHNHDGHNHDGHNHEGHNHDGHDHEGHNHSSDEKGSSDIKVEVAEGGISIAEVFKNRKKYSGKKVIIKGKVVKFNSGIMGKNWAHIQDGTKSNENFDLTVTTDHNVNVGDVVTFEGEMTLNKDFGSGYSYEVIMESAVVKK